MMWDGECLMGGSIRADKIPLSNTINNNLRSSRRETLFDGNFSKALAQWLGQKHTDVVGCEDLYKDSIDQFLKYHNEGSIDIAQLAEKYDQG